MITLNHIRLFFKHYVFIRKASGPEKWTELNYVGLDFNLDQYLSEIKSYSDRFQIKNCYSTDYQGKEYETLELNWVGREAKKKLLLSAGMHGNEISGVLAIPEILNTISQNPEDYRDWEIKIITPVNPVGVISQSRYNKDGYDINRDFKKLETLEAQKIKEIFFSFKPDLILNLHEAPQKGFIILANHCTNEKQMHELAKRLSDKIELAEKHYFKTRLEVEGLEREGWFLILLSKIARSQNFEWIAYETGVQSITSESPWSETNKEKRTMPHVTLFKEIIGIFK